MPVTGSSAAPSAEARQTETPGAAKSTASPFDVPTHGRQAASTAATAMVAGKRAGQTTNWTKLPAAEMIR